MELLDKILPGAAYSLAMAVAQWGLTYFTTGEGGTVPWAAIAVAVITTLLKSFTVQTEPEPAAEVGTRGLEPASTAARSKMNRFLIG